jgi:nitrate reductase NapAB chaperone NapD
MVSQNGNKPEDTIQDLLALIQGRNQRIADLELQVLKLNRNQCKCEGECNNANGKSVSVQEAESKNKRVFGEKAKA